MHTHTKYLGIDYGAKRIGIAVSDNGGTIAFPRTVIPNDAHAITAIVAIAQQEGIRTFVIGDTRASGGRANTITDEAEDFARRLEHKSGIPVETIFELGSSIEASLYTPEGRNNHDDSAAASIILQRYLDMHHGAALPDTLE